MQTIREAEVSKHPGRNEELFLPIGSRTHSCATCATVATLTTCIPSPALGVPVDRNAAPRSCPICMYDTLPGLVRGVVMPSLSGSYDAMGLGGEGGRDWGVY